MKLYFQGFPKSLFAFCLGFSIPVIYGVNRNARYEKKSELWKFTWRPQDSYCLNALCSAVKPELSPAALKNLTHPTVQHLTFLLHSQS